MRQPILPTKMRSVDDRDTLIRILIIMIKLNPLDDCILIFNDHCCILYLSEL